MSLYYAPQKSFDDIEEEEPDEWDLEMIEDSKIDNPVTSTFEELLKKLGVSPNELI